MTQQAKFQDSVYGVTFGKYTKSDISEFLAPFKTRLQRNNLDGDALFQGKRCLDAGCGNGRGSILMADHGAKMVHSVDISSQNIASTTKNMGDFGFADRSSVQEMDLTKLDFPDEHFDFVWCNGVVMHTYAPNDVMRELTRVLKKNGQMWLYLYGGGGFYWHIIEYNRRLLADVPVEDLMDIMRELGESTSHIAEYIDNFKTMILRGYSHEELQNCAKGLSFSEITELPEGTDYDTSARNALYPSDLEYLGVGDLRYLLKKGENAANTECPLPDVYIARVDDMPYRGAKEFTALLDRYDAHLRSLSLKAQLRLLTRLQRFLRDDLFMRKEPLDINLVIQYIKDAMEPSA